MLEQELVTEVAMVQAQVQVPVTVEEQAMEPELAMEVVQATEEVPELVVEEEQALAMEQVPEMGLEQVLVMEEVQELVLAEEEVPVEVGVNAVLEGSLLLAYWQLCILPNNNLWVLLVDSLQRNSWV